MNTLDTLDAETQRLIAARAASDQHLARVEAQRNDPLLRLEAYKLVIAIGQDILCIHAHNLAMQRHGRAPTAWEVDTEADRLVHALVEFLSRAEFTLEPDEPAIAQGHQLGAFHAGDWFDVDVDLLTQQPVAMPRK